MEQYSQVSLDPNTQNYLPRVVGDMVNTLRYDSNGSPYLERSGSFTNRSRFIRIEGTNNTFNYINSNGSVRDASLSGSLPAAVSGTFAGGSDGNVIHPRAMNENIFATNTQGFNPASGGWGQTAYQDAIDILSNKDQYDINLLFTPGLIDNLNGHGAIITRAINMCEDRGDVFYVIDPTYKGSTVGQAQLAAEARNTNYACYYYPWCMIPDPDLGRNIWVPPSAIVSAVYSFNDLVAHPWYAPAGLNRGTLDTVIQTERLMTQGDRDNLYIKSVNPIATFPRQGVTVWGQKTLQKKQSAFDRINVRRLLIDAKKFIAFTVKYLVFENNTVETRARFIEITDPYFRRVKNQQGLYDYRIIIDESNNTPDVVDRNEMRAQIYLKPAKTAEFIIVDFLVLPTGALFPTDTNE
jgi:phage tail sheath protein FI